LYIKIGLINQLRSIGKQVSLGPANDHLGDHSSLTLSGADPGGGAWNYAPNHHGQVFQRTFLTSFQSDFGIHLLFI